MRRATNVTELSLLKPCQTHNSSNTCKEANQYKETYASVTLHDAKTKIVQCTSNPNSTDGCIYTEISATIYSDEKQSPRYASATTLLLFLSPSGRQRKHAMRECKRVRLGYAVAVASSKGSDGVTCPFDISSFSFIVVDVVWLEYHVFFLHRPNQLSKQPIKLLPILIIERKLAVREGNNVLEHVSFTL